jgi:hypothetical protein
MHKKERIVLLFMHTLWVPFARCSPDTPCFRDFESRYTVLTYDFSIHFQMRNKPFTAAIHCSIDYAFVAIQLFVPSLLGVNRTAVRRSRILGSSVLALNSLTKSPVALKSEIPFKTHGRIDCWTLGGLALLTLAKDIRKDKKALAFHLGFLAMATANVFLTDWNSPEER